MKRVTDLEDKVARAIYKAHGWTHWPLDSADPDRDAGEICDTYWKMARAAIKTYRQETKTAT